LHSSHNLLRALFTPTRQWLIWSRPVILVILTLIASSLTLGHTQNQNPQVKLNTSYGSIVLEIYPDKAPNTAKNFLRYVKEKHYDGTIFHRVIPGFMIQGGGYDSQYNERITKQPIRHEGRFALSQGLHNTTGYVAMARTIDPQSASAQFFINLSDNLFLDPILIPPGDPVSRFEFQGKVYSNTPRHLLENSSLLFGYTVFGRVLSGLDVLNKIKSAKTGPAGQFSSDVPLNHIIILSATIENH